MTVAENCGPPRRTGVQENTIPMNGGQEIEDRIPGQSRKACLQGSGVLESHALQHIGHIFTPVDGRLHVLVDLPPLDERGGIS